MKNYTFLFLTIILFSCTSVEVQEFNDNELNIDENVIFLEYLENDWQKNLNQNPLFASYVGDKRSNDKINSNSIIQFIEERSSEIESLNQLYSIDQSKLSEENQLNYKLKEFGLKSSIGLSDFPTYFLRLNQRGGIQSFYETGNRLVYTSKEDYFDWLSRLKQFSSNINNSLEINKEGLSKGITQPKIIVEGVVTQIDAMLNTDIDNNPYLQVFLNADESIISIEEKNKLIEDAKFLIINEINPAYQRLNSFLKNEYLIKSRDSIGIGDVPGGKDYYEYLAKYFTTTELTPDEIHQIGLDEIKRIRSEMDEIIKQVNWDGDFNSFLNYLRTSPRFYYDNSEDLFNAYLIMSKTIDPLLTN